MQAASSMAQTTDVVVVGAGMAGLVTAVQAAELGARVMVVEKGEAPGGTLAMSGGTLWCATTPEGHRRLAPMGDPKLGGTLVQGFGDGVAWLKKLGASLTQTPAAPYHSVERRVYRMDPTASAFAELMADRFAEMGGTLMTRASVVRLHTNTGGSVSGVAVRTGDGVIDVRAGAVVVATGGFAANPELKARYFGRWSDRLIVRVSPNCTGDGYLMGTAAGAASSLGMSGFYGHLMPAPPARVPPDDFVGHTQYYSEQVLLVNLRGERFTDESLGDEANAQATAREPEALSFMVFDEAVRSTYAVRELEGRRRDAFSDAKEVGARAFSAPTLEALAEEVGSWGVYGAGLVETVTEYTRAVGEGRAAGQRIPRRANANPVSSPPFYALAVTPGVTLTYGGLRIDSDARVLDNSARPIPGLYAAGADAGGIHVDGYGGALCLGLVFGRRAARNAVGR